MLKASEIVKCPHCGQDPTGQPVTAGELVANLQSDEVVTYYCEACERPFTVEERLNAKTRPVTHDVKLEKA